MLVRFAARPFLLVSSVALVALAGCGGGEDPTPPVIVPPPDITTLGAGSQSVNVAGGAAGAEYTAVVTNMATDGTAKPSFTIMVSTPTGAATASASLASNESVTAVRASLDMDAAFPAELQRDYAFEDRLRTRERALAPRIGEARAWMAARRAAATAAGGTSSGFVIDRSSVAVPAGKQVGDIVTVNVNGNVGCSSPIYHPAKVVAIGTRSIVLNDTLNPKNGFTTADFQRFAARFDTLVYPLDTDAFGAPTDIDANGHIVLIFTRAVNELTPSGSSSYVGGFTYSRDLFPIPGGSRTQPCAASNEGEMFYLLTPDPSGQVNGNVRTVGFVDTVTTAVIAHEFQHLINASRRIYVNLQTTAFEEKWLDEALAHIAEELLFYREAGLTPRSNINYDMLASTAQRASAYNNDQRGNAGRLRLYLQAPQTNSPYAANDSLATRGAGWSLLRYLADRQLTTDGDVWFRLVNSNFTGITNAQSIFGPFGPLVRDWSVSNALDDVVTAPEFQQRSWNWRDIYTRLSGSYPLVVTTMATGQSYSGLLVPGGAAYYKFTVPANTTLKFAFTDFTPTGGVPLQVVVRQTK